MRNTDGESPTALVVRKGEEIAFPVPKRHRLARFQILKPVETIADLEPFMPMWTALAKAEKRDLPPSATLLADLRKAKTKLMTLSADEFKVESGAKVTLNGDLNHFAFDTVTIDGDLVSNGHLAIYADTINAKGGK